MGTGIVVEVLFGDLDLSSDPACGEVRSIGCLLLVNSLQMDSDSG